MSDFELDDDACPRCNHSPTHARPCEQWDCDDGYIDEHSDDPINYAPGQSYTVCRDCHGTGIEKWCPRCGLDLTAPPKDSNE